MPKSKRWIAEGVLATLVVIALVMSLTLAPLAPHRRDGKHKVAVGRLECLVESDDPRSGIIPAPFVGHEADDQIGENPTARIQSAVRLFKILHAF